jgi:hypothetical protein
LREHVAIQARQCAHAGAVVQDAVAADSFIHDREIRTTCGSCQTFGKKIRPIGILALLRADAVGDGITERYGRTSLIRSPNFQVRKEVPRGFGGWVRYICFRGEVTRFRNVGIVLRPEMD